MQMQEMPMEAQPAMGGISVFLLLFFLLVIGFWLLTFVAMWMIVAKTGYPGVLSLLFLVPLVNIIFLFYLAFSEWPLERQARGSSP